MKAVIDRIVRALTAEFKEELEDLSKRYAPRTPVRLCAECFELERKNSGRQPYYYYRFDDDGSCERCGKDVTASESTGVESMQ